MFQKIGLFSVKFAVKLRNHQKTSKTGSLRALNFILGGGNTPSFGHGFSKVAYLQTCGKAWLSSVQ